MKRNDEINTLTKSAKRILLEIRRCLEASDFEHKYVFLVSGFQMIMFQTVPP